MIRYAFILGAVLFVAACSTRPTSDEIEKTVPDCSNAQAQIKMLKQEMITTQERIAAGAQSIIPSVAIINLFAGRWQTNKNIATGEYEEMLNKKILEIQSSCGLHGYFGPIT